MAVSEKKQVYNAIWRPCYAEKLPRPAPNGVLRRRKRNHVINLQLDADLLADLVVVVRRHER